MGLSSCAHVRHKNDLFGTPFIQVQTESIADPTTDLTFMTPANEQYTGKSLWSDLHWSQIDKDLPENQRRVEVSVQRTVTDAKGNFLGVLRVGLFEKQIDKISSVQTRPSRSTRSSPYFHYR